MEPDGYADLTKFCLFDAYGHSFLINRRVCSRTQKPTEPSEGLGEQMSVQAIGVAKRTNVGMRAAFIPWYRSLAWVLAWGSAITMLLTRSFDIWFFGDLAIWAWSPLIALTVSGHVWKSGQTLGEFARRRQIN